MNKQNKLILNIIGIFFIVIVLATYINLFFNNETNRFFWYCYIGLIIMAIAMRKNSFLLVTQMNILLLPTIMWTLDFIWFILTGNYILGISSPFFTYYSITQKLLSLEHIVIPIFSILALYIIKIDERKIKLSLIVSLIELYIIFFITRLISNPIENLNCVYQTCLNFNFPFYYPISWSLIMVPSTIIGFLIIWNLKIFHKSPNNFI